MTAEEDDETHRRGTAFITQALANPINRAILGRLPELGLADCWLVAGALFQTVWNLRDGRPPTADIHDYDLFYFDDSDLSWDAEDSAIGRAMTLFADLDATVELRNQARVHLWYEQHFGEPCPRLTSSRHGIERFLVAGTCLGLRPLPNGEVELCAPFGVSDAIAGVLRPNPVHPSRLFHRKAESYRARWPWLVVADSPADAPSAMTSVHRI